MTRLLSPQVRACWNGDRAGEAEVLWGWQSPRGPWWVEVRGPFGSVREEERDAFEALTACRRTFEPAGWRLGVAGCRRDCWPSGMARDQGGGLVVYRLTQGSKPGREDLVQTFASAEAELVVGFDEQVLSVGLLQGWT